MNSSAKENRSLNLGLKWYALIHPQITTDSQAHPIRDVAATEQSPEHLHGIIVTLVRALPVSRMFLQ
jgi:hypothetical protein